MAKTLRIVHLIKSMAASYGGPPQCVAGLASAQAMQGFHVSIVGSEKSQLPVMPRVSAVEVYEAAAGRQFLDDALGDPAVLFHVHGLWDLAILRTLLLGRFKSIRYVIKPDGMLHPWALRQKQVKKRIALLLGWRAVLNHAQFVHALNEMEKAYIANLCLRPPITVIPNGIDPEEFSDADETMASCVEVTRLHRPRPYVLFLGRLHLVKGLDLLIRAFRIVAAELPVDLVIAGPDGGAGAICRDLAQELISVGRVSFVGPVFGGKKIELLKGATCLCQPSRQEGFSMTIAEAMACATPIVISKECNFPEALDAGAGLVTDLNVEQIANALVRMIADRDFRDQCGMNGQRLIMERYTWPIVAARTYQLYSQMG